MDQKLKHRLTGAIVLVSLAVIFIPVILEGPDNEWTPLNHGIPDPPQLDYKARMDLSRSAEIPVPVIRAREVEEKPAPRFIEPAREKVVVPAPKPVPAAPEKPAAEAPDGWYVQVGSFARELNASGLSKRLKLSGYEARFQKTTSRKGHIYRVIVGPDTSRAQAEKVRDRLAREHKLEGIVINNPG